MYFRRNAKVLEYVMNYWWTADLHLGHANIIKYCNRPFKNLEHMNKVLIRNWNERVKKEDIIFHVGDFCFRNSPGGKLGEGGGIPATEWEKKLNGKIIHIKGNHDCFSKDTRVLTKEGYKYYYEIKEGELIPTVNLKLQKVEFKPIKEIIINKVNKVYGFKGKFSEGKFSNNHRHLRVRYNYQKQGIKYYINKSENIWDHKSSFILLDSYRGGNLDYNISNDWLKLLAWVLTGGGINKTKSGNYYQIIIYQSKPKYVKEIRYLLNRLKIIYKELKQKTTFPIEICGRKVKTVIPYRYNFILPAKSTHFIIDKLKIESKYKLPEWLYQLSDRQVKLFITEVIKGDGTFGNRKGSFVIYGKKEFLLQLLGLCVTHGISSRFVKVKKNACCYLSIHKRQSKVKVIPSKIRYIRIIDDIMWDVNVDNHIIFTELNGCPLVTGNSSNSCKTIINNITINYGGKRILLIHNPEHAYKSYAYNHDLYFTGHVHEKWEIKRFKMQWQLIDCINVGVDVWKFKPVSFNEIIRRYSKFLRNNKGMNTNVMIRKKTVK